jgi:hypothetical protein
LAKWLTKMERKEIEGEELAVLRGNLKRIKGTS